MLNFKSSTAPCCGRFYLPNDGNGTEGSAKYTAKLKLKVYLLRDKVHLLEPSQLHGGAEQVDQERHLGQNQRREVGKLEEPEQCPTGLERPASIL